MEELIRSQWMGFMKWLIFFFPLIILYQFFEGGSWRIVIHGVLRTGLISASGSVLVFFY
jgi:hypothetical protein